MAGLGKDALAKPSAFYRHIHPELFSDSKTTKTFVLTKALAMTIDPRLHRIVATQPLANLIVVG